MKAGCSSDIISYHRRRYSSYNSIINTQIQPNQTGVQLGGLTLLNLNHSIDKIISFCPSEDSVQRDWCTGKCLGVCDPGSNFGQRDFYLPQSVQTGSWSHQISYSKGTGSSCHSVKVAGAWCQSLIFICAEMKNEYKYSPQFLCAFTESKGTILSFSLP